MKKSRVLFASVSGSVIEWYDFYLYGTATGLVFSSLFFPNTDPAIALLLAFATFGVGYAARPIGSIIFGHFGDKLGRKASLMLTLVGMGGSSFLIGCLPTYAQIGVAAPLLLVFLRLIQGIALGGEWGGAVLLATEYAPKGLRGLYGSIPQLGVPLGLVLGSFSLTFISYLTTEAQFLAWGWRIPFLFSALLIGLALWIRNGIEETPAFKEQKEKGELAAVPIVETFRTNSKSVFHVIGLKLGDGFFNVFLMSFVLVFATKHLGYSYEVALTALTIGCATMIITIPVVGYLSDFIGRKIIYICGLALLFLLAIPYFTMVGQSPSWLYIMQAAMLGIIWASIFATQGTIFSELFPAKVRYTGLSFGYQIAAAIVGFGPMIWTPMAEKFGPSPIVFGGFMMAGITISLVLSLFVPDTRKISKYEDNADPIADEKAI
ncbi:arabinose efflux permease family protein [Schinkia azotoformans MEV2011]|uniref:Putative proline/betaine transporter n=1 Tax=Schinkia azotoformans MEV2011 TaxID=1348973 RepID=A0A072NRZ6_SCHAZ|nr:MFS transporter [Schinkia azotoformans]KEF39638.1 arabinose efflux permease family protein [Schinkia azotoformans MEV2011]MEC1695089.1 MFS transporter [Schinkia azotoformans]MEC1718435.1 MFS transporter [Schinkia azotoformans]MEC1726894.1 MFS transporter [Schinkia azotoformans]MEC1743027.1 MFS transporter [Schinkia azotoformans]